MNGEMIGIDALYQVLVGKSYLAGDQLTAADLSNCYVLRGYRRSATEDLPSNVQAF